MASGKKRRKGRQGLKPRGNQAAGAGSELGSVGERDAARQWAQSQQQLIGYTAPDPQLPEWMAGMGDDDQVPIIIATGGAEPPESAGELIGTLNQPGRTADGTVIEAGARVYRALRELTREEMAADPRAVSLIFGDSSMLGPGMIDIGKPAPLGESRTAIAGGPVLDPAERRSQQAGRLIAGERGWPDPAAVPAGLRRHGNAVIPSHLAPGANEGLLLAARDREGPGRSRGTLPEPHLPPDALARLEGAVPGLTARLSRGLGKDELGESAGEIAKALHQAGAGPGTYTFGPEPATTPVQVVKSGSEGELPYGLQPGDMIAAEQPAGYELAGIDLPPGTARPGEKVWRRAPGPQLIVTDDLNSLADRGEPTLVIEDLDPGDEDGGRLLTGSPDEIRRYHELVAELDRRSQPLIAGPSDHALVRDEAAARRVSLRTSWTGEYVMDMRSWLAHHYGHPAPDLADYLARLMRDAVREDYRAGQMYWPVNLENGPAGRPEGMQLARIISRGVAESTGCQVTAEMCAKMRADWDQDPGSALPLDEGELPRPEGFAWLDQPWLIRETAGYWLPVRAVSWEKMTVITQGRFTGGRTAALDAARIVLWLLIEDDVAFGRWEPVPSRAARVTTRIGRLIPFHIVTMPFGMGARVSENHSSLAGAFGLIHTLWRYLGETLPKSRPVRAVTPAVARRAARSLTYDELHIIALRQYEYIGETGPHFPGKPDWRGRWWVDEFYRHIDRYDDGTDEKGRRRTHKATPAGRTGYVTDDDHDICAVCLANEQAIRISLVHTFAKGPTDKPFLKPSKERTLLRLSR